MVSLPLREMPSSGMRNRLSGALDAIRRLFAVVGAATRVANAVESHRRPHADDLRTLGIREYPSL